MAVEKAMVEEHLGRSRKELFRRGAILREGRVSEDRLHLLRRFSGRYRPFPDCVKKISNAIDETIAKSFEFFFSKFDGRLAVVCHQRARLLQTLSISFDTAVSFFLRISLRTYASRYWLTHATEEGHLLFASSGRPITLWFRSPGLDNHRLSNAISTDGLLQITHN
jgi:hypothetical protein